jgi:hypothetical protein
MKQVTVAAMFFLLCLPALLPLWPAMTSTSLSREVVLSTAGSPLPNPSLRSDTTVNQVDLCFRTLLLYSRSRTYPLPIQEALP